MNSPVILSKYIHKNVRIAINGKGLEGELTIPKKATAIVIFAHGSGSSRLSPRNKFVAKQLNNNKIATLLIDLLEPKEDSRSARFDIDLLCERLSIITDWTSHNLSTSHLSIGYFGSSTGAAAVIMATAQCQDNVFAIVSRGGRVDLAQYMANEIFVPTLLIVGENDMDVLESNQRFYDLLPGEKKLEVIKNAGHLFEEPGCLQEVADKATEWFNKHLA